MENIYKSKVHLYAMDIKNLIISVAVLVLTLSVSIFGVKLFYSSPEYNQFCGEFRDMEFINTSEKCEDLEGKWIDNFGPKTKNLEFQGYCDLNYYCGQEYERATESYSRNVFLIAIPVGIALIFLGFVIFGLESVGAGLMAGGVGTIIYGVGGYWRFTGNLFKFTTSLMGLIAVILIAYKFNSRFYSKKKKIRKVNH